MKQMQTLVDQLLQLGEHAQIRFISEALFSRCCLNARIKGRLQVQYCPAFSVG